MEEGKGKSAKFSNLRQQAKKATPGQAVDLAGLSDQDIQNLIYELQVNKTQLERQNEALRQTQEQLKKSRNKYSDLYDFAPVGYFTVGENGLILEANLTGANLLGVAKNSLLKEPFFCFIARDSQDQFYVHCQQVFETKSNQVCELKLVKQDGRQFYAQLDSIVVSDRAGNFSQFHTTVMDVTERRQAQERLRHQEKMAAIGQLASGVAHNFNNTLQTIIGFAELLVNSHQNLPLDVRDGLQHINQQSQSAAQLVRRLLDFSRRSMSEQQPLALAPFLQELLKLLERTIPENIQLRLEHASDQYWIKADPIQLEQALLNLAVNARDAMPDGGMLHINLIWQQVGQEESPPVPQMSPGEWIAIRVSDTGEGIPEHIIPHLFEPFFTTKSSDEGTGLGLSQAYGIVRRHKGYLDVTSQVGIGTAFTLYLPALPSSEEILPDLEDMPHGQGETILLVEDESAVLETVQVILKHLNYQVLTASNGRKALKLYDQHSDEIGLVLTDVIMPGMSGLDLAQVLWEREPALKVVIMTGYLLETETEELSGQGIVGHLQKPLSIGQLAETINYLLKHDK